MERFGQTFFHMFPASAKGQGSGKILGGVAEAAGRVPGSGVFNMLLSLLGISFEQIRAPQQTQTRDRGHDRSRE